MSSLTQVVNLLEHKLNDLLENYQFLKEENELLYTKLTTLEHQSALEMQKFKELEEKYKTLKIAKTIEGSKEDRRETKLKINALIREVDACINELSE